MPGMLSFLVQLPSQLLGQSMLRFLELIDLIQFENAAASHESQDLLYSILPYSQPVVLNSEFIFNVQSWNWFNKRKCCVKIIPLPLEIFGDINFELSVLDNISVVIERNTSFELIQHFMNPYIGKKIKYIRIEGSQNPLSMEILFSHLTTVHSLTLSELTTSNQSHWIKYLKNIGSSLKVLELHVGVHIMEIFGIIISLCQNIEVLTMKSLSNSLPPNILKIITQSCPRLKSLDIRRITYPSHTQCNLDIMSFVKKYPHMENLTIYTASINDESVATIAQHCSKLKKLTLDTCILTISSLLVLSEHNLPVEELCIPTIFITDTDLAFRCAHALSRIRFYETNPLTSWIGHVPYNIPHMTGLQCLTLGNTEDHLMIPSLLRLCSGLHTLHIHNQSSINRRQFTALVEASPNLRTVFIDNLACATDTTVMKLARHCTHLEVLEIDTMGKPPVTDASLLVIAENCLQLRELTIPNAKKVTETTVRKLIQCCRRLIKIDLPSVQIMFINSMKKKKEEQSDSSDSSSSSGGSDSSSDSEDDEVLSKKDIRTIRNNIV